MSRSTDSLPAANTFPTAVEDFQNDTRISWSRSDQKWVLEFEDQEYEFDTALKRWVPVVSAPGAGSGFSQVHSPTQGNLPS